MTDEIKIEMYQRLGNFFLAIQKLDFSKTGKGQHNKILTLERIIDLCYPTAIEHGFWINELHHKIETTKEEKQYNTIDVKAQLIDLKTGHVLKEVGFTNDFLINRAGLVNNRGYEQDVGNTLSYFRRYNLQTLLGITGEDNTQKSLPITLEQQVELQLIILRYNYLLNLLTDEQREFNKFNEVSLCKVMKAYKHIELKNFTNVEFNKFCDEMHKRYDLLWKELIKNPEIILPQEKTNIENTEQLGAVNWKKQLN